MYEHPFAGHRRRRETIPFALRRVFTTTSGVPQRGHTNPLGLGPVVGIRHPFRFALAAAFASAKLRRLPGAGARTSSPSAPAADHFAPR